MKTLADNTGFYVSRTRLYEYLKSTGWHVRKSNSAVMTYWHDVYVDAEIELPLNIKSEYYRTLYLAVENLLKLEKRSFAEIVTSIDNMDLDVKNISDDDLGLDLDATKVELKAIEERTRVVNNNFAKLVAEKIRREYGCQWPDLIEFLSGDNAGKMYVVVYANEEHVVLSNADGIKTIYDLGNLTKMETGSDVLKFSPEEWHKTDWKKVVEPIVKELLKSDHE